MSDDSLVEDLLRSLHLVPVQIARFYKQVGSAADDSASGREYVGEVDEPKREMLDLLRKRAFETLRYSAETVDATSRLLQLPSLMFTPGTVIRSGLESAGLVCWLSDLTISTDERVQRAIAIGKEDWNQEVGLARAALRTPDDHRELHEATLKWAIGERDQFVAKAARIQLRAISVPKDSDLVALCDADYEYRLNTGLAHGNPTVHRAIEGMFGGTGATPDSMGRAFFNSLTSSADSCGRGSWAFGRYVLADSQIRKLRELPNEIYESLHMTDVGRDYFNQT